MKKAVAKKANVEKTNLKNANVKKEDAKKTNVTLQSKLALLCVAIFCSGSVIVYRSLGYYSDSVYTNSGNSIFAAMKDAFRKLLEEGSEWLVIAAAFGLVVLLIGYVYLRDKSAAHRFVFEYRYVIALLVLALCVLFKLSGSSIGQWAFSLPYGDNEGLILGRPRGCRTDEYALFTGMTFAQYYDPQGSWPYFGEVLRATSTDMFMVYGQPVLDPSILLRPFQVGFLFLGLSRGLSFYWSARLIALFMASFEFGRMITGDKRGLSLAYALLVALAPAVSWWFSINSLVEMIICISVIAVCFNLYVQEGSVWAESKKRRILLIVVCVYACLVFVFSVYPAWQVPLAYVLLAVIVALAVSHRSTLWGAVKADKLPLALCICVAVVCVVAVALHSSDAILTEMNTDYPGDRIDVGGSYGLTLFRYPVALFLSFVAPSAASGLSVGLPEVFTAFMDFFPLGIVLAAVNLARNRRVDSISVALVVVALFLGLYIAVGFPELIAKVSLMGKSIPARAIVAFSLVNLMLLFREIPKFSLRKNASGKLPAKLPAKMYEQAPKNASGKTSVSVTASKRLEQAPKNASGKTSVSVTASKLPKKAKVAPLGKRQAILLACVCVVAAACLTALCWANEQSFMGAIKIAVVFTLLLLVWLFVTFEKQKPFIVLCVVVAVVSGAFVNPVQKGIEVVDKNPLITQMREISQENPDAKWVGAVSWMSNMTLFAGAPAINSTNIYPNQELWQVLDPSGESKAEWNRYAHLPCTIVSENIGHNFNVTQLDSIAISLTLSDLDKLGVSYIVTNEKPALSDEEMARLTTISVCGDYTIYKLESQ